MCGSSEYPHQLLPAVGRFDAAAPLSHYLHPIGIGTGIGGGAYPRMLARVPGARAYRVRKLCAEGEFATITAALAQWQADKQSMAGPRAAIIDIADSAIYHEAPQFHLGAGEQLQLRAASLAHPVLRMFDYGGAGSQQVRITAAPGSKLTLDGLLVAGGGIDIDDGASDAAAAVLPQQGCMVTLRHCTLVPGWDPQSGGEAPWRGKPSVVLHAAGVALHIDHSIVGPIRVAGSARRDLHLRDSIVDAGHAAGLAIADALYGTAPVAASITRSTVIGLVQVAEITLAENAIFVGPLLVARRFTGSLRFCYVAQGSRTPQRASCQPDQALQTGECWHPRFQSLRYGAPGYCQLAPDCPIEITCGADDDGAMGARHDRLAPSAPAGPSSRAWSGELA